MRQKQQIIATHDTLPADRSPMDAVTAAIDALSDDPAPRFIAMDTLTPYPVGELGAPDWLIVTASAEQPASAKSDWRDVIRVAPQKTSVVLLSRDNPPDIPSEVLHHIDLTGWRGTASDPRIAAVARRIAGGTSGWRRDDMETEALRRGALIHVGDGTTTLNPKLLSNVADLNLPKGTQRVLRDQHLIFVGDLVQMTDAELLRIQDLGPKRLAEIKAALKAVGLVSTRVIPGWPPEDIEAALEGQGIAETLARMPQAPSGEMFSEVGTHLTIDPAVGSLSDRQVGASAISIQLQAVIRRKLETLSVIASRMGNHPGWHDLAPLCDRLVELLDRSGADVAEVLGTLYGAALELGSFAEMDAAARTNAQSMVEALDPSAARPLQDVVTSLAPWLRRFPTIRELDDEGGRFLVAQTEAPAAREAFAAAAEVHLIRTNDADQLRAFLDAGERGSFVGGKAGRRGILSARNLVLVAATIVAGAVWDGAVSEYAAHSIVTRRAGSMLVRAENAVLDIAAELPADVRSAIREVITRTRTAQPRNSANPSASPPSPGAERPLTS
jgi:hypothetical protein